ncbi:uncharacterized protein LOC135168999 [Diachasmimorpha longicaudata]|uniref:uncharacterized protein LOC135168999 n=1 Tax=Diachasmimorpha longicaudata TaxID=58733 RepID=UPI0030B8EA60
MSSETLVDKEDLFEDPENQGIIPELLITTEKGINKEHQPKTNTGAIPKDKPVYPHIKTRESWADMSAPLSKKEEFQTRLLLRKVDSIKDINTSLATLANNNVSLTIDELEGQELIINTHWSEFQKLEETVIEFLPNDHDFFAHSLHELAEELKTSSIGLIYQLKGLTKRRELAEKSTPPTQSSNQSGNQLKRIELNTFDGRYSDWKNWSDLYLSMVGSDPNIPGVQKLARLKGLLKGSAAALISTFSVTEENYDKAWRKLVKKYEDPRLIAQALFNRVLNLPKIHKASSENLTANAAAAVETLDQLPQMTKLTTSRLLEQMIIHLLRQSLDSETLKMWELKLGECRDFPTLEEFTNFIESYARGINSGDKLHSTSTNSSTPRTTPVASRRRVAHVASTTETSTKAPPRNNCAFCTGRHYIASCEKFIALSPIKRVDIIISKRLCFNCLGPHLLSRCTCLKSCYKCKAFGQEKRHHTLLHGGHVDLMEDAGQLTKFNLATPAPTPAAEESTHQLSKSTDSTATERIYAPLSQVEESTQQQRSTATVNLNNQRISAQENISENQKSPAINSNQRHSTQPSVLLATALVKAASPRGYLIDARVLIDQGSEISFITDNLVHQLHLKRAHSTLELIGIGGTPSGTTRGVVPVVLHSTIGNQQVEITAHILKKLTTRLPSFSCSTARIGSLQDLQLADPDYLKPGPIDIIIGSDNYGRIIKEKVIKSTSTQLVGQQTAFGWIISGPINCQGCSPRISLTAVRSSANEQLLELLQKFWVQEEINNAMECHELSPEDHQCEMHFQSTHSRDETGRYVVRLPLKTSATALGDSRLKATRQLHSVMRRLQKDEAYSALYKAFIREYHQLNHLQEAPETPEPSPAYYLPHHGVLRDDAITTKLRVVFNGSSASSTGISLNDILYSGGKLQVDAVNVLTWVRKHQFVFGTDIVKMFRQIRVHQDDWDLQRILWLNEDNEEITYQLTTVTYGLNCSPWISLRVLQQLVEDEGHRFPAAVETLRKGRYVDDIYGGADSIDQLKEIATQLQGLCEAGGFPLQKWSSNSPEALQQLGLSPQNSTVHFEEAITKVLGLCWQQSTDTFKYKAKNFTSKTFTKRSVLSEIAQIFDPLGFIAPVVILGKIFIQSLWRLKLKWDDPLPTDYVRQWRKFRAEINELDKISIPRWLRLSTESINIQLHGFADASKSAMSAVVYIRSKKLNEPTSTIIVCAKTRVAPLKEMTIPRLELTAALLLTRLAKTTHQMLELNNVETHLWSDSSVALAWISSHPSRWKEFVHNRVAEIQKTLPEATWRHISGKENPADCASRGISTNQLIEHPLWWSGPDWLNLEPDQWPQSTIDVPAEVSMEAKPSPAHPVAAEVNVNALAELLDRYSALSKVLQVSATINRAINRFRRQPTPQTPVLTPDELNKARLFWVKLTQKQFFASAIRTLRRDHQLPTGHQLAKMTPFLDELGIMRVGGRLRNAQLDADEMHPIILPRQSRLTTLVINEAHQRALHGGTQLTLAITRQKYWIIGGRGTVRSHILHCVICTRYRAQRAQQLMGQLPTARVSPSRAFLHTGVDYAGPMPILKWRPTNAQPAAVHIAVFVCLSTSAVHLELVTRQSTDAFIAAFKRFTGRRGIPQVMYSDNGSNFEGAAGVLHRLYNEESPENQQIQAALATNGTRWSFIPPRAPHFGGKWEAAVKSTKYHLKRTLGTTTLTYEELNTILIQIEACLNSRPISPMSDDPDDLQSLTPGHFLIGEPLQLIPEPSYLDDNPSKMHRWNVITQKIQQFWSRWSKECLQRYLAIYKWNQRQENIKVGDMVLVVNENFPPARWPLARVTAVHPGDDGLTRVATVKTAYSEVARHADGTPNPERYQTRVSTWDRPITKLCLLPTEQLQEDQQELQGDSQESQD